MATRKQQLPLPTIMLMKQSNILLHFFFAIFLFYANNSAKSRSQDRQERVDIDGRFSRNTLKAAEAKPTIPKMPLVTIYGTAAESTAGSSKCRYNARRQFQSGTGNKKKCTPIVVTL